MKMDTIFAEKKRKISDCVLALDLDGTLTNSKKEITPVVRCALKLFGEMGGQIILASGRPTYGVMPVADELELQRRGGYILSYNGGCVTDCRTGHTLYQQALDPGVVHILASQAREYGVNIITYQDRYLITEQPEEKYCQVESAINHMEIRQIDSFSDYVTFPVIKCLMTAEEGHLKDVEERMKAYWEGQLNICRSEPYFLEITGDGIDKAQTLRWMLRQMGKEPKDLIACGDGYNDLSMIRYAGIGVAMANAQSVLKKAAQYIAPSNDEDGIADVVCQLVVGSR